MGSSCPKWPLCSDQTNDQNHDEIGDRQSIIKVPCRHWMHLNLLGVLTFQDLPFLLKPMRWQDELREPPEFGFFLRVTP
jgi:hypothetical protein